MALLIWKNVMNRPRSCHGGETGKLYHVAADGLLLADVDEADVDELLGTGDLERYERPDGLSRIRSEHPAAAPAVGVLDVMRGLQMLLSTKDGRTELRSLLTKVAADDEDAPRPGPSLPAPGTEPMVTPSPRDVMDSLRGFAKAGKVEKAIPLSDDERTMRLAEAHRLYEAHKTPELIAAAKEQGLAPKPGAGKETVIAQLLGLPEDWRGNQKR